MSRCDYRDGFLGPRCRLAKYHHGRHVCAEDDDDAATASAAASHALGRTGKFVLEHGTCYWQEDASALITPTEEVPMSARKLDEFIDPINQNICYRVVLNGDFPIVEKRVGQDALGQPSWAVVTGPERHDAIAIASIRIAAGVVKPEPIAGVLTGVSVGKGG